MASAWRNLKNISSRPLFTIIFRPEMLKFQPYSILTGETMVGFVIYCVLKLIFSSIYIFFLFYCHLFLHEPLQKKHMQKNIARNKENKYIHTYYSPFSFTFGSYLYRYINPITAINQGANYAHHMGVFLFDLKMSMQVLK